MGGKRPDQYQIDRDEAGATDYKTYPDLPEESGQDNAGRSAGRPGRGGSQPIKPSVPSPGANNPRVERE